MWMVRITQPPSAFQIYHHVQTFIGFIHLERLGGDIFSDKYDYTTPVFIPITLE